MKSSNTTLEAIRFQLDHLQETVDQVEATLIGICVALDVPIYQSERVDFDNNDLN